MSAGSAKKRANRRTGNESEWQFGSFPGLKASAVAKGRTQQQHAHRLTHTRIHAQKHINTPTLFPHSSAHAHTPPLTAACPRPFAISCPDPRLRSATFRSPSKPPGGGSELSWAGLPHSGSIPLLVMPDTSKSQQHITHFTCAFCVSNCSGWGKLFPLPSARSHLMR